MNINGDISVIMGEKDLVSVIIPTYNREKYIIDSIQSVLRQTYSKLECIVVDDGSVDGTEKIINQMKDARLRYYRSNVNEGQAAARNRGIELAKGRYIAFNDSDDIWEADKLQKQLRLIDDDKTIGMVYCRYVLIEQGKIVYEFPDDEKVKEITAAENMFEFPSARFNPPPLGGQALAAFPSSRNCDKIQH